MFDVFSLYITIFVIVSLALVTVQFRYFWIVSLD